MKIIAAIFLVGATLLPAQTVTANPPVITEAQKLAFFKANSEFQTANTQALQAQQNAQQKSSALQTAIKAIEDACGKDYRVILDSDGYPVCVVNPKSDKGN